MPFPKLRVPAVSRQMTDTFGGYNHNLRIGDGEFYDMKNMTSDDYPLLSTRRKRGVYTKANAPAGLIEKDNLCYVDGTNFVFNGMRYDMGLSTKEEDCPKQLISMGAYVIILPDKQYFNTGDDTDHGKIEAEFETTGPVTFSLCKFDSSEQKYEEVGDKAPEEPADGTVWLDTSEKTAVLKQWSESAGMWVQIASTYVKISATGIDEAFAQYDGIVISGLDAELKNEAGAKLEDSSELAALNGAAVVWNKGDGYIIVVGILSDAYTIKNKIKVARKMPVMDYVIECGNRLWGCRYGPAANGEVVNEIYASKLGDFKNWTCFMGISTDSWTGSVGTDGVFTGAIAHMGYPLFFKENHMHKVYISATGAHQLIDTACRGVQRDCNRSLAIVGETLYYKARNGICAYDGSLPTEISQAMGNELYKNAVAGAHGSKYYVSMEDSKGQYHLFVYDTRRGMWHREDDLRADGFCTCRDELYCIEYGTGRILALLGSGEQESSPVEWMAESGMIGLSMPDMKHISRINLRMQLAAGSQFRCWAEYDSSGRWIHLFTVNGRGTRAITLPVRPVRCDHMRLKLEGIGEMKLFSVTKSIEQGSDVR